MKKRLFLAAALLVLAACTREMAFENAKGDMTLVASMEGSVASRTVIEGGSHIFWEPGDEIAVFSGGKSAKFTADLAATAPSATFKGTLGKDAWSEGMDLWAVYPYSDNAVFDGETVTTVLPDQQVGRAGSFGKGMNLAIAQSTTTTLQFYNVGGGVRFTLSQDGISEVVFEGLNGEVLAGKVKVGFQDGKPVIQEVTEGKTSITVTAPEGESFKKDAWYYIVAIPGALENGFSFHFRKASDPNLVMPSTAYPKAVTIKRGIFGMLTYVDQGMNQTVPDDIIAFKDPLVKSIVVKHFDTSGDGELSYHEAAVVLSFLVDKTGTRATDGMESIFAGTDITTFDELVFFTGLTRIEDGAFAGCTRLTSVIIPETVEYIGADAFNGCTGLTSITINSDTPPEIGTDAFANTGDCPILVPEGAVEAFVAAWPQYEYRIDGMQPLTQIWYVTSDGNPVTMTSTDGFGAQVVSNEYADGKGILTFDGIITSIGDTAFSGCQNLTEISLPGRVTRIGCDAFYDCGLTGLDFPDSVTRIDEWAISSCPQLEDIFIPANISYVGYGNFAYCNGVKTLSVDPDNPVYDSRNDCNAIIETATHKLITGCQNTLIPESVRVINTFAFGGCESLRHITIPEGVKRIAWRAFSDCSGLEELVLPGSLLNLGVGVFERCTSLKEVTIPENVIVMGFSDFQGCTGLTSVTVLPENPPTVNSYDDVSDIYNAPGYEAKGSNSSMFANTGDCPIYVPAESLDAYLADPYWGYYADRIQPIGGVYVFKAVDLGLPSGVKWATYNLGASSPGEAGDYYAWGETEPYYSSLDPLTWKEGKEAGYDWPSYKWYIEDTRIFTKYTYSGDYKDYKFVLDPEDDAAAVLLGDKWRMPTAAEFKELLEKCSHEQTSLYGTVGWKITGPNGNSIFLPGTTGYWRQQELNYTEDTGNYWTCNLYSNPYAYSIQLATTNDSWFFYCNLRSSGIPIRPVFGDPGIPIESITLDKTELELEVGESAALTVTILPEDATIQDYTWRSGNEMIATVSPQEILHISIP